MKALALTIPQEAPVCMDALFDYVRTWHSNSYVYELGQLEIKVEKEIIQSELMIFREHFPWLNTNIIN